MCRLILPLFLLSCTWSVVGAQDGLFPATDARARLAGGTGLTAEGIDALWTNPAGLAAPGESLAAAATVSQRFGLTELTVASAGAVRQAGKGGLGLTLASFGFSAYRENRLGIAYGRRLTDNFSIGAEFAAFTSSTVGYAGTFSVTVGVGMQLRVLPTLLLGARIFSPFRTERLPGEYLPQLLAIGLGYRPSAKILLTAEVHQDLVFPVRTRYGLEYQPAETVRIYLGVATAAAELSFGAGYEILPRLYLNAGAAWHETLGTSPVAGVRWR